MSCLNNSQNTVQLAKEVFISFKDRGKLQSKEEFWQQISKGEISDFLSKLKKERPNKTQAYYDRLCWQLAGEFVLSMFIKVDFN